MVIFFTVTPNNPKTSQVALVVKNPYNVGDVGSIPGSGRSPGVENGNQLQYSCLDRAFHEQNNLDGYSP